MFDFTRKLSLKSAVPYIAWKMRKGAGPIILSLRCGVRFELRRDNSTNNDYGVAYEVFVHDYYVDKFNMVNQVKLVVDLGANVGYSVLYFLHKYPTSCVIAVEPHASHARQLERNLLLDGNRDRVEIYAKAAAARARFMRLTNRGTSSSLTGDDELLNTQRVEAIDIFEVLSGAHIDLLKMDVEGGEYEILGDERFSSLDVGAIVMEWHSRGSGLADRQWCEERLSGLGFLIRDIFTQPSHGMFWAVRS